MKTISQGTDVAVLVSGGLDSCVLCVDLVGIFERVHPIHVRFGLRWEETELNFLNDFLSAIRHDFPAIQPLTILDEPIAQVYGDHWSNAGRPGIPGAETDDAAVYLPGRNVLLATKSAVWCRLRGVDTLAFGTLAANPFPDSSPGFFDDLAAVLNRAMGGELRILQPYARMAKSDVLRHAEGLGLPTELTFSCLNPIGGRHCGACNKCAERHKAFREIGGDRTDYARPMAS